MKRRRITQDTALNGPPAQVDRSERLVGHLELATHTKLACTLKSEPRVVGRIANHEHGIDSPMPAFLQPFANQDRTDSATLTMRNYRQRSKRQEQTFMRTLDCHSRKGDVPHDLIRVRRDQRDEILIAFTQRIDQCRFAVAPEGSHLYAVNGRNVASRFESDPGLNIHLFARLRYKSDNSMNQDGGIYAMKRLDSLSALRKEAEELKIHAGMLPYNPNRDHMTDRELTAWAVRQISEPAATQD